MTIFLMITVSVAWEGCGVFSVVCNSFVYNKVVL